MTRQGARKDLLALLREVESVVEHATNDRELARQGVHPMVILIAVEGLRAYLENDTAQAVDDLATAVELISLSLEALDRAASN